jgi:threonine dehydrogenase-like Zn-dependent dehydrogenase
MSAIESHVVELLGPKQLRVRTDVIDPDSLNLSEIACRTICSLISPGTEIAAYRGDPPLRPMKAYPRVVGYCNVAEVLHCADAVRTIHSGDRILTNQSHRSAFVCDAQQVLARVPSCVESALAATTYLFQLGYNAVSVGKLQKGQSLAVVGLGTLGLATAAVANVMGARVYAFSDQNFSPSQLAPFGIREVFRKSKGTVTALTGKEGAPGVDLVVTTSNAWCDWQLTLALPRKHGTICVLGFPGRGKPLPEFNPLSSEFLYDRQLSIIGCGMTPDASAVPSETTFNLQSNCRLLLDWIARGMLPARELITATVPWREIGSMYERIAGAETGFRTAALDWVG